MGRELNSRHIFPGLSYSSKDIHVSTFSISVLPGESGTVPPDR